MKGAESPGTEHSLWSSHDMSCRSSVKGDISSETPRYSVKTPISVNTSHDFGGGNTPMDLRSSGTNGSSQVSRLKHLNAFLRALTAGII